MLQPVADADVLREVRRVREARLAGPVIEDLQPAGTRHEMHPIPTQVRVRRTITVEQGERARRRRDRGFDDIRGKQHPRPGGIRWESVIEEPAPQFLAANLDADLGEDPLRLIDDRRDQLRIEDLEAGAHRLPVRKA